MTDNYTPGPWTVTGHGSVHSQARNGRNWACQSANIGAVSAPPEIEQAANARLIAAAPDMLEALRLNLAAMEEASRDNRAARILSEHIHATRAAIARATRGNDT